MTCARDLLVKAGKIKIQLDAVDRAWHREAESRVGVRDRTSVAWRNAEHEAFLELEPKYGPMVDALDRRMRRLIERAEEYRDGVTI